MDKNMELPEGWKKHKLGDICVFEYGKGLIKGNRDENGEFYVYGSNGVVGSHSKYLIDDSCIIVGRKGAAGEVHLSLKPSWPIDTTYYIKQNDKFLLKFLYYYLKTLRLAALEKSTAIPGLNRNDAYSRTIYLPPIHQQQQIVQKIEELFSELDKGIENLKTAQEQLKVYRQAVLKWAFEGRLTNENIKDGELPEGWRLANLNEVSQKITDGEHFKPVTQATGIPFLSAKDVRDNGVSFNDPLYISESTAEKALKRCNPQKGDLLMVSRGATVGRMCIVDTNRAFCLLGSVILIKVNDNLDSKYLNYVLKSSSINQKLISVSGATAQQAIYLRDIKNITFPYCSLVQQKKVILEIESRLSVCDKIEDTIAVSLQKAESLRQSILKKAFEGKLVKVDKQPMEAELVRIYNNDNWHRKVLAGHIVYAFQKGGYIGRTKLQKILYLCEQHAQLDFDTHYIKEAAGPLDPKFLYAFLNEGKQKNWIEETQVGNGYKYEPSTSISELTIDYPKYFRSNSDKINFVIKLLRDTDTDTAELIATVYAIWNNYIIKKQKLDETLLAKEVYDWDDSKAKFNKSLIASTWQWMKEVELIPVGFGKVIDKRG